MRETGKAYRSPMDGEGYTLTWEQVRMGRALLERWAVRVTAPHLSVEFATVGKADLRDVWLLRLTPKGPGAECPCLFVDYMTREKAMAHVERWARSHWRQIPVWPHPQKWGGN